MTERAVHRSLYGAFEVDPAMVAGMSPREVVGWAAIGRALARWSTSGAAYAAIPHELTARLGISGYPMSHLAPAIDPEGRFCGFDGFYRDELAGVDWWCLLPYDHGTDALTLAHHDDVALLTNHQGARHGWDRIVRCREWTIEHPDDGHAVRVRLVMAPAHVTIRDAYQVHGLRAELDDIGPELLGWVGATGS